ncbi:hypothetical protein BTJ40_20630 [Microbulbifer sp. A4B17]|uniref:DUF4266 domain-containing protein n=1 Tax=Microbulbifer sp. A4B17 TaxID=359370 RepID=UPI000D52BD4A|nr:DUF4266 domain-containing protein [Microbulbifer sp. A4B17]AWF83031.1 hypothetical protein BTJ40_20630 [Microbulbifer sp. A4B17]
MRALLLVCTLLMSTGCTISPWIAPYERQFLADPIMGFEQDPVAARYMNHVYEAREAARGAEGGSGGGCGCN